MKKIVTDEMVEAGLDAAFGKVLSFQSASMDEMREALKAAFLAMDKVRSRQPTVSRQS